MTTEQFWKQVKKSRDCWNWLGKPNSASGYGRIHFSGKRMLVHRYVWLLTYGDPGNLCVLHHCDNSSCVRPDHLFLGTIADNNRDKTLKNRQSRGNRHSFPGEKHPKAVLTYKKVSRIRKLLQQGTAQVLIARQMGVSPQLICGIKKGRSWTRQN